MRRLSDTHIVGQAAAEAEFAQEGHPAHTFTLVVPELAVKTLRLFGGLYSVKSVQALTNALEDFIELDLRLRRQQSVQQSGLILPEAKMAFFLGSQTGERSEIPQFVFELRDKR